MTSPVRIHQEQIIEAPSQSVVLPRKFIGKLLNSATPPVLNVEIFECSGAAITITNFEKGQHGQSITLLGDGLTTIAHNSNIKTSGAADRLLESNKIYKFTNYGGVWYEDSGATVTSDSLPPHNHDDRYHTITDVDNALLTKSDIDHTHPLTEIDNDRSTVIYTTGVLLNTQTEVSTIALGKAGLIYKVEADRACRVRLYSNNADLLSDELRSIDTDPSSGFGLILDFLFTASLLSINCSPIPIFANIEDSTATIQSIVQNRSGASSSVQLTFTRLLSEA